MQRARVVPSRALPPPSSACVYDNLSQAFEVAQSKISTEALKKWGALDLWGTGQALAFWSELERSSSFRALVQPQLRLQRFSGVGGCMCCLDRIFAHVCVCLVATLAQQL